MSTEATMVALFAVATAVAVAARRLHLPYTVALVLAGLALGGTQLLHPPHLTQALLYSIILPGLLFEAGYQLELPHFWRSVITIGGLSVPGVLLSGALMAPLLVAAVGRLHLGGDFGLGPALLFAALIVATDPIAVVGLFKTLSVPRRLATLVEGESLFNDGTAVAFYTVVLAALDGGGAASLGGAVLGFARIAGLGLALGGLAGLVAAQLLRRIDDPMLQITVTTIVAYGTFVAGEAAHASGVIATVTAAMGCGSEDTCARMSASTRLAVHVFWEYVAFAMNSIVFLLIGLEVPLRRLLTSWRLVIVAYLIVTLARALLVATTALAVRPTRERMPWSWALVIGWGGLRGALSMVLALSVPARLPSRELILTMTFGVVVLSILLQGLTMSPLLRRLKLAARDAP